VMLRPRVGKRDTWVGANSTPLICDEAETLGSSTSVDLSSSRPYQSEIIANHGVFACWYTVALLLLLRKASIFGNARQSNSESALLWGVFLPRQRNEDGIDGSCSFF
jgi:hypothetical protein